MAKTLYIDRTFSGYNHSSMGMSVYCNGKDVTIRTIGEPNSDEWSLMGSVIKTDDTNGEWWYGYNSAPCPVKSNRHVAEAAIKTYISRGGFPRGYVALPLGYRLVADLY